MTSGAFDADGVSGPLGHAARLRRRLFAEGGACALERYWREGERRFRRRLALAPM